MKNEMTTVLQCLESLKQKGFHCNFDVDDTNRITCKETCESFPPEDIIIENTYRFEGDSDPADMSIIYSVTAKSGTRGILIDAYGTYSNPDIDKFIKSVPVREKSNLQDK